MTRKIEIIAGGIGAVGGFIIAGPQGALIGGIGAGAVTAYGVNSLRSRSSGPSIYIDGKTRREMESTLHIAIAASWALRPLIETEPYIQRRVTEQLFGAIVESYTSEVTPYVQEMQMHLMRVVMSGIKPDDSLAHVRRTYAPRFMRKDDSVSFMIAKHILAIQDGFGAFTEAREWFLRWSDAVGLGKYGNAMWLEHFGDADLPSYAEWKVARRKAAMDSYFEDEEAA